MTIQKENTTYERIHDACRICGLDADCMTVDQETGLCTACVSLGCGE